MIGLIVSRKLATLHELQTVYGAEDAYNMLEIILVDNANEAARRKEEEGANGHGS